MINYTKTGAEKCDNYDFINPDHYKSSGNKEVFEMMVDIWGEEAFIKHCEMCAFKYRMRLGRKPDAPIERDLEKAKWYEDKAKELRQQAVALEKMIESVMKSRGPSLTRPNPPLPRSEDEPPSFYNPYLDIDDRTSGDIVNRHPISLEYADEGEDLMTAEDREEERGIERLEDERQEGE